MEYEAFKEDVLKKLREICGGNLQIRTEKILKNNGKHYDGVQIFANGVDKNVCPAIPLQWFYSAYCDGDISIAGCAKVIYETSEEYRDMVSSVRLSEPVLCRLFGADCAIR